MIGHLRKIALYSVDNLALTVLNCINEGVDGATDVIVDAEPFNTLKIDAGRSVLSGYNLKIDIRTLSDSSILADLLDYAINPPQDFLTNPDAGLQIAMLGLEACFVSNDRYLISFNEQLSTNYVYAFQVTKTVAGNSFTASGLRESGVNFGKNLLGLYNVSAGDTTDLYGFSASGDAGLERIEVSGVQDLRDIGSMVGDGFYNTSYFLFPFVGQSLTFSINVTVNSAPLATLNIAYYDSSQTIIGTISTVALSGTGIQSVSKEAPANTVYVRAYVAFPADNGAQLNFKQPMLGTNGNTTFEL